MDAHITTEAEPASVLSLREVHGALTHLPIVALAVLALLSVLAWRGIGGQAVRRAEPWAFGASFVGVALAGLSGLLVNGRAKTSLRGGDATLGSFHLSGGRDLRRFRRKHGQGLFPAAIVSDQQFAAINTWLATNPAGGARTSAGG